MQQRTLTKGVITVLLLALSSVAIGIFLPGFINYQNHSFSTKDIFDRLDSTNQNKIKREEYNSKMIAKRKSELLAVISDTTQNLSPQNIFEITKSIENLNKLEQYGKDTSIKLMPFYPKSKLLLLWPFLYFGLSILAFFIRPKYKYNIDLRAFATILILLIVFIRWPTWTRNTAIGNIDRVVYSIANFDISKLGFFVQEAQSIVSIVLMSIIICKWLSYSENLKRKLLTNTRFSELYYLKIVKDLRSIYQEWQLCSIFLALAFGYYTYYFWATINETNDFRYLPHAIIIHVVWGLIWFAISMPLFTIKNYQINFKENFLRQQVSPTLLLTKANNEALTLILKEDPISSQNQSITALISGATFLLPIIKAFI